MKLTLNQAAKECGRAKSTLSKAIKSGKLSAEKGERGSLMIDASELSRVFPPTGDDQSPRPVGNTLQKGANTDAENLIEIVRLQAELDAERRMTERLSSDVDDLRQRLDKEAEDRRATQARLEDLRERAADGQQAMRAQLEELQAKVAVIPPQEAQKSPLRGLFGFRWGKGAA
ncbi:MAG: hypothetical protein V2I43_25280 [Parvularcula sp.]|jgi:chromosome segregation ATPase|nr:hypothetical protein [Parvularcula sp.]